MHNTITLDQANHAVDQYVDKVLSALSATAEKDDSLALNQPDVPCTDESSEYDQYLRFAQRVYPITGGDARKLDKAFTSFHKWSQENGFNVDRRNEKNSTDQISRASNKAGYKIGIDHSNGTVNLKVSSQCVWRNGHPETSD